jgi:cytochrome P450
MAAVDIPRGRRGVPQALTDPRIPRPPRRRPPQGDIFEFTFLGARYAVAVGADIVADLNDEKRFCKHLGPEIVALRILGGDGLFTAHNHEPNWHRAHQLLMPAFTQAAMRRYHPTMVDVGAQMLAAWDAHADNDTWVDVSHDTTRMTLETIGRCAAGYSFGTFDSDAVHPFVEHMVAALRGADTLGVLWLTYLPRFVTRIYERRLRRHAAHLHRVADQISAARRAEGLGHHDDLLELMLSPPEDGRPGLDEANIRYQLINFLVAGHETTSGTLSFALYFLSTHPEVFARASR